MENQTIIVKKIKKAGHGHHGGGWKVAFADFAVAMMAFFLLLWLIAATTPEEKAAMSDYFTPTLQGLAEANAAGKSQELIDLGGGQKISEGDDSKDNAQKPHELTQHEIEQAAQAEKAQLESLMEELKKVIEASQALKPFKDQLLLDIMPEGLRIQIVDKENRPMFDSGSAELKGYTKQILHELAKTINTVENRISLTGHTDASRFVGRENYSNWELSADRANASRRELVIGGLAAVKMAKVVGLSSMVLFNKAEPGHPINRRIAIIVMNKAAEKALFSDGKQISTAAEGEQFIKGGESGKPQRIEGSMPVTEKPIVKPIVIDSNLTESELTGSRPTESELTESELTESRPTESEPTEFESKRVVRKVDLPPAQEGEQKHINIPSPISPINPIVVPTH